MVQFCMRGQIAVSKKENTGIQPQTSNRLKTEGICSIFSEGLSVRLGNTLKQGIILTLKSEATPSYGVALLPRTMPTRMTTEAEGTGEDAESTYSDSHTIS